jgi:hypothetical protein
LYGGRGENGTEDCKVFEMAWKALVVKILFEGVPLPIQVQTQA